MPSRNSFVKPFVRTSFQARRIDFVIFREKKHTYIYIEREGEDNIAMTLVKALSSKTKLERSPLRDEKNKLFVIDAMIIFFK